MFMLQTESPDPLSLKLQHFVRLSRSDRQTLSDTIGRQMHHFPAHRDLVVEGDRPQSINIIMDGWAYRYKILEDGRRQITNFFLPGDMCDLNLFVIRQMDHSIASLTPLKYVPLSPSVVNRLSIEHPRVFQAMWWEAFVASSIQREWIVSLGQRSAIERVAHLFCELFVRLRSVGRVKRYSFHVPVTQLELADAMGMTPVHVNRTLRELREKELIQWKGKVLNISDFAALQQIAMFNAGYLHLDHDGAFLDADD